MGYSIMTPFKNEKERDKMFEFIEQNYKTMSELLGDRGRKDWYHDKKPTCDLGYRPNNKLAMIGFNYNCPHPESTYLFTICYWMAVMAGRRKNFKDYKNMPYVNYDGAENWALFVNTKGDRSFDCVEVDEYGFRTFKFHEDEESIFMKLMSKLENKIHKIDFIEEAVKQELVRLTELWKNENSV